MLYPYFLIPFLHKKVVKMANPMYEQIIKNGIFDLMRFGETITYRAQKAEKGEEIIAIVEIGESLAEEKAAYRTAAVSTNKTSDTAMFTVMLEDVPKPEAGDVILYNAERWIVRRVSLIDSVGGNVTVEAERKVRGFGR